MCIFSNFFVILHPLFWNGMPEIQGEVQEWLNWHAWKACVPGTVPGVRIPLSPQKADKQKKTFYKVLSFDKLYYRVILYKVIKKHFLFLYFYVIKFDFFTGKRVIC